MTGKDERMREIASGLMAQAHINFKHYGLTTYTV